MKPFAYLALVVGFLILFGCAISPKSGARVSLRWVRGGPSEVGGFKCFGLNVVGEGIPSVDPAINADWESVANGKTCSYPGSSTMAQEASEISSGTKGINFELKVMPGKKRVFQVVGIHTTGSCPTNDIGELFTMARKGTLPTEIEGLYEVGRSVADVVKTGTVTVSNAYSAASAYNVKDCFPKAGTTFSVSPSRIKMFPGDVYQIKPEGGVAPYKYRIVEANTFASLTNTEDGLVVAAGGPPIPGTVEITDFAGAKAYVQVELYTPGIFGTITYWYKPGQFLTSQLDDAEVGDLQIVNAAGLADAPLALAPSGSGKKIRFRRKAGPNGHPTLELYPGNILTYSGPNALLLNDHALYLVARRTFLNGTTGLICFSSNGDCTGPTPHTRLYLPGIGNTLLFEFFGTELASQTVGNSGVELPWDLYAGKWGGGSGPAAFQVRRSATEVAGGTNNATMSVSGGVITVGPSSGNTSIDYLEIAEIMVLDLANSPASIEGYLKDKYSLGY